jgi:hypothetical protein
MQKDDSNSHGSDEQENIEDDSTDTETDDDGTLENTEESDDSEKETAEDVKNKQKAAWLAKIRGGQKKLEDMPDNLKWLRKEVESELKGDEVEPDELESRIRKTLQQEREAEDFGLLTSYLGENEIDEEVMAEVRETYEDLLQDGVGKLKALKVAMRSAGLKDSQTVIAERRKKGMLLPPNGTRPRKTVVKDGLTDLERKLSSGLPNGYKM